MLKFFDWAYVNGGDMALELEYVPLPKATVELIRASWGEMKDSAGLTRSSQPSKPESASWLDPASSSGALRGPWP